MTFTTSCISEVSTCTDEATTTDVVLAPAPSGMVIVVGTNVDTKKRDEHMSRSFG